ncbi:MAG TPA: hypothetical protein DCP49_01795 [Erysipelotrichaceae bacterium]|nr:hypothetical protein [Erysipelotrichaceae bacterium]
MKSELEARPIYGSRREAIEGYLLICFLALMVYQIIDILRTLNIEQVRGAVYKPGFVRSEITDQLAEIFGYHLRIESWKKKN